MNQLHKCPRCAGNLSPVEISAPIIYKFNALECNSCSGKWFQVSDLDNVEKIYEVKLIEFRKIPSKKEQMEQLSCPICKDARIMTKVTSERDKKVIMDVCLECKGVWLDKGELEAIQDESLHLIIGKAIQWMISDQ